MSLVVLYILCFTSSYPQSHASTSEKRAQNFHDKTLFRLARTKQSHNNIKPLLLFSLPASPAYINKKNATMFVPAAELVASFEKMLQTDETRMRQQRQFNEANRSCASSSSSTSAVCPVVRRGSLSASYAASSAASPMASPLQVKRTKVEPPSPMKLRLLELYYLEGASVGGTDWELDSLNIAPSSRSQR